MTNKDTGKATTSLEPTGRAKSSVLEKVSGTLSELSTGKKVAAGVGLAVVAGGVAAIRAARNRAGSGTSPTIYHLEPGKDEGWILTLEGAADVKANFETKEEGLAAARELAKESAPSELVIHLSDGSEQTRHNYDD